MPMHVTAFIDEIVGISALLWEQSQDIDEPQ
jgi:hypothetical protein